MIKCDLCKRDDDCCGKYRRECVFNDYSHFLCESISDDTERERLKFLLKGKSLDTDEDIEYVADYLIQNGVRVL